MTIAGTTTVIDLDELFPLDLAFSPPNGERLLIRARVPGSEQVGLYTMNLDGSDRQTVVPPVATGYGTVFTRSGAVWSPDGKTIAYNGIDEATAADGHTFEHFRVHLVNADGTNDRAVPGPADPAIEENWPIFSPDGKSIAVIRWTIEGDVFGANGWLAIMPSDGGQAARDLGPRFADKVDTGITKTWSPDGTRLLMFVGSRSQVYSLDPATGASELLPWTDVLPDWQRLAR